MAGAKKRQTAKGLMRFLGDCFKVVTGTVLLFYLMVLITAWV